MQDSESSQLLSLIKSKFSFLAESEILEFMKNHPWLVTETDPSILLDYLLRYSQSLAEHYNEISSKLTKMQDEWTHIKPADKKLKTEEIKENPIISEFPSEDAILMGLINKFDEMKKLFEELNENQQSDRHFSLIYNILWKIQEFPDNPNFRQIIIDPQEFMFSVYLTEIFGFLGFVKCDIDDKLNMIYTDDKFPFFKNAMEFIESEYLPNVKDLLNLQISTSKSGSSERITAQMNVPNNKLQEQANHLAKVHENRLNNKNNNFNNNNNFNQFSLKSTNERQYQENMQSVQDQLKEYRNRMRQRNLQNNQFTGHNIMTMNQFSMNQEITYNNGMGPTGFQNRVVTMEDIDKKKTEENKVNFGKKTLQLTNEFRKSQGKTPLEWNQNLCVIGMKHSKDMADRKVPFGHQGFNERARSVAFEHGGIYENVAFCYGMEESSIPKV